MIELPENLRDTYWTTVLMRFINSDDYTVELSMSDGEIVVVVNTVEVMYYPVESFEIADLNEVWRWLSDDARELIIEAYTND